MHGFGNFNCGKNYTSPGHKDSTEVGEYRYQFQLPSSLKNKVFNLVFEGVMKDTEVWINGKSAGPAHLGIFSVFKYDISESLKFGKTNLLEVKVYKNSTIQSLNTTEHESGFLNFGGIYRPVYLEVLSETHFNRIDIDAKSSGELNSSITLNKSNKEVEIQIELTDLSNNKVIESFSSAIESDTIRLTYFF